ncbi:MAG: nucleoside/nucleotide kinase family protein [Rhizobiaceae bacterium]|nr:nucleoside/nucleotide kinase family protein [Rhizobiaceae bacterium]
MSEIAQLAAKIFRKASGRDRFLVAVAGAPGSGKSTLAAQLVELLAEAPAALVPMDGFHFDNQVIERRGLLKRKGAPETFDFDGLKAMLMRLRTGGADVAVPVFDRAADLARASAAIVAANDRIVIVEGNYLLLDEVPWNTLAELFDCTIFLDVPRGVLAHRLVQRWLDHGLPEAEARERAFSNDMVNVERVVASRRQPDVEVEYKE